MHRAVPIQLLLLKTDEQISKLSAFDGVSGSFVNPYQTFDKSCITPAMDIRVGSGYIQVNEMIDLPRRSAHFI